LDYEGEVMGANLTPAFGHPSPKGEGIAKLPLSFRRGGWGVRFLCVLALASQALTAAPLKSAPVVVGEAPQPVAVKKLIFLDFYNEANDKNLQYIANSIGDAVHDAIKSKYRYDRISSSSWKKYAAENKWQQSDFYDQKKIREMGKALGADGVIYGKYNTVEQRLELHGIIFSVIDGEVVEEQHASAPLSAEMFEKINEVSDNLAKKIKDLFVPSDRGALTRSLLFPGWGHYYKQRNGWGNFWAISGGTAIAFTATMGTMFVVMKNQYDTYNPQHYRNTSGGTGLYDANAAQAEFDRLEASANQFGQLALIGGAVTAGIWLGAMLHAYFIEPDMGNAAPPKQAQASPLQWQLGADHSPQPGMRCAISYTEKF
jgi:hypothetical protein